MKRHLTASLPLRRSFWLLYSGTCTKSFFCFSERLSGGKPSLMQRPCICLPCRSCYQSSLRSNHLYPGAAVPKEELVDSHCMLHSLAFSFFSFFTFLFLFFFFFLHLFFSSSFFLFCLFLFSSKNCKSVISSSTESLWPTIKGTISINQWKLKQHVKLIKKIIDLTC